MRSEWSDYRHFLAVARGGSLSHAARQLSVDQSTVGRRLTALETAVGARLFDRTPDGYALTAAGESVQAELEQIEAGLLAVERRLAGGDSRIAGVVRVATTEAFASIYLIPHLAALRSRHPELSIELVAGIVPVDLARREADIAIRIGAPPRRPNLVVRQLGVLEFGLYGARSYLARRGQPRRGTGLRGHDIVAYGGEMAGVPIARWVDEHAQHAHVAFRANTIAAVFEAVAAGTGLGALPSGLGRRRLVRIASANLGASPIWTIVHEDLVRSARVRAVSRFVTEIIRKLSGESSASTQKAEAANGRRASFERGKIA
jgi:DNA-binding transcriptional LysR family regulator